jgi:hypothetical protein
MLKAYDKELKIYFMFEPGTNKSFSSIVQYNCKLHLVACLLTSQDFSCCNYLI